MKDSRVSLLAVILLLGGAIAIGLGIEASDVRAGEATHKSILAAAILSALWGCIVTKCYEMFCHQRKENR